MKKNILDTVIVKCNSPKYFSKTNRKIMDKFAKDTRDLDYEQVIVIDNNGNIITENRNGASNHVGIDEYDIVDYVVRADKWVGFFPKGVR